MPECNLPHQEEYESRLAALQVSELNVHLQLCCLRYLQRLKGKEDHHLSDYILNLRDGPESPLQQTLTALMDKNLFNKFSLCSKILHTFF